MRYTRILLRTYLVACLKGERIHSNCYHIFKSYIFSVSVSVCLSRMSYPCRHLVMMRVSVHNYLGAHDLTIHLFFLPDFSISVCTLCRCSYIRTRYMDTGTILPIQLSLMLCHDFLPCFVAIIGKTLDHSCWL